MKIVLVKPRQIFIWLLAVELGLTWFWTHYDSVAITEIEPPSREVLRNPYLALERLATQLGWDSEGVADYRLFSDLPPSTDVVIAQSLPPNTNLQRTAEIMAWLNAGGRLITAAPMTAFEPERGGVSLAEHLGVRGYYLDGTGMDNTDRDEGKLDTVDMQTERRSAVVKFWSATSRIVDVSGNAKILSGDLFGARALSYNIGRGSVIVFVHLRFWENHAITDYDHAYLLSLVLPTAASKVWIMYGRGMPNLLQWLGTYAPHALISAGFFLVALLWSRFNRFGALLHEQPRQRRAFADHLRARAHFAWMWGQGDALLAGPRRAVEQRAALSIPEWPKQALPERARIAAGRCGMNSDDVAFALYGQPRELARFVAAVSTLQKLKRL